MSIAADYEREEWEAQGGWRGVEPSVSAVTLLFADDETPDDLEDTAPIRTETPIAEGRLITVSRQRHYRTFLRLDAQTWQEEDAGERAFTETLIIGASKTESTESEETDV